MIYQPWEDTHIPSNKDWIERPQCSGEQHVEDDSSDWSSDIGTAEVNMILRTMMMESPPSIFVKQSVALLDLVSTHACREPYSKDVAVDPGLLQPL